MTRTERMETSLYQYLQPLVLEIHNESDRHHVPEGSETHFKIVLVSEQFVSLSRVERHRLVNKRLTLEWEDGLHALSLHLHTPAEWEVRQGQVAVSPDCRDGYGQ